MNIDTKAKTIIVPSYVCTEWENVDWIIRELYKNAEFLWGKRESTPKTSGAVLTLVKNED